MAETRIEKCSKELCGKRFSLQLKEKVHQSCVQSAMLKRNEPQCLNDKKITKVHTRTGTQKNLSLFCRTRNLKCRELELKKIRRVQVQYLSNFNRRKEECSCVIIIIFFYHCIK